MLKRIRKFETISRHEASLRQTPAAIECLANVLNYIKSVLTDDATETLYQMIQHHFLTRGNDGITAHYMNIELLANQILSALRQSFVAIGIYTDNNPSYGTTVPEDYNAFVKWLVGNQNSYDTEIPDDYDALCMGLTLKLAEEWFTSHHDAMIDAHQNTVTTRIDQLMNMNKVIPSWCFNSTNFFYSLYQLLETSDFNRVMDLVTANLLATGSPLTIDFTTYPESTTLLPPGGFNDEVMMIGSFLTNVYPSKDGSDGVDIMQLYNQSASLGGGIPYDGYDQFLLDYGEITGQLIGKKFLDYYYNHLRFVLSDSMSDEYKATLTALRQSVNTNYSKSYNIFTVLNRNNWGIRISANINKLATDKTLDLINLTGLSKSVCCVSLVPVIDVYQNITNNLTVSFDNYNPQFTSIIGDPITLNEFLQFDMVVTASKTELVIHTTIGDQYSTVRFPNTGRLFDVNPFFLFVPPRVDEFRRKAIRLSDLRLYGKSLSDDDSFGLIAGFRKQ